LWDFKLKTPPLYFRGGVLIAASSISKITYQIRWHRNYIFLQARGAELHAEEHRGFSVIFLIIPVQGELILQHVAEV